MGFNNYLSQVKEILMRHLIVICFIAAMLVVAIQANLVGADIVKVYQEKLESQLEALER